LSGRQPLGPKPEKFLAPVSDEGGAVLGRQLAEHGRNRLAHGGDGFGAVAVRPAQRLVDDAVGDAQLDQVLRREAQPSGEITE
jgi:hypothetical protein